MQAAGAREPLRHKPEVPVAEREADRGAVGRAPRGEVERVVVAPLAGQVVRLVPGDDACAAAQVPAPAAVLEVAVVEARGVRGDAEGAETPCGWRGAGRRGGP